jgi:hypothetical protein
MSRVMHFVGEIAGCVFPATACDRALDKISAFAFTTGAK